MLEALSAMSVFKRQKKEVGKRTERPDYPEYSVLVPEDGFDYGVPLPWRSSLFNVANDINKKTEMNTNFHEVMCALLAHALDAFKLIPFGEKDKHVDWYLTGDGHKVKKVKIIFNWPKFLGKRLSLLASYRTWPRSAWSEHLLIEYILLDARRRGINFVIEALDDYRGLIRTIEEDEKKEREKNAKSKDIGRDAVNSSAAKHSG